MRTAADLQAEGARMARRGSFVPVIYPRAVALYTEHQVPHIVSEQIPMENDMLSPCRYDPIPIVKYTDIMIDLETLGTEPGCVITQIGAVAFNAEVSEPPEVMRKFPILHVRIDPQSAIDAGFTVSWATISWWMQQSAEARESLVNNENLLGMEQALRYFQNWMLSHTNKDRVRVWGNGATFDITLLEVAFRKFGLNVPWSYRGARDMRTLYDLPPTRNIPKVTPAVEHDALSDAIAQAAWVNLAMTTLVIVEADRAPDFINGDQMGQYKHSDQYKNPAAE